MTIMLHVRDFRRHGLPVYFTINSSLSNSFVFRCSDSVPLGSHSPELLQSIGYISTGATADVPGFCKVVAVSSIDVRKWILDRHFLLLFFHLLLLVMNSTSHHSPRLKTLPREIQSVRAVSMNVNYVMSGNIVSMDKMGDMMKMLMRFFGGQPTK